MLNFDKEHDDSLLTFEPNGHIYKYNGVRVRSVTQYIDLAGLVDKTWYTDNCREEGTNIHLATQYDAEKCLVEDLLSDELKPRLKAARSFEADYGFVPQLIEHRFIIKELAYCGTLDRYGKMRDGQRAIVDYKRGPVHPAARLQLAAYAASQPDPATIARYAVQLKPNGTYDAKNSFPISDFASDFADFLAVVRFIQLREKMCPQKPQKQ